jgi:hypothetical protein
MRRLFVVSLAVVIGSSAAFAKGITVKSWCPMTKASGIGKAVTFEAAKSQAIQKCLANGGMAQCCPNFTRQI